MKILVDMNLSPEWVAVLTNHGLTAVHTQYVSPGYLEPTLIHVIENNRSALKTGCLIVVEEARARVRILPLTLRS